MKYIATNEIRWIDLQFVDVKGSLHRTSISNRKIEEGSFGTGVHGADLTKVFGESEQGELALLPDPDTMARLPWEPSTVRLLCNISISSTRERFLKDSRYVAERMETNLSAAGVKNARIGSEVECFIFDTVTQDRTAPGRGSGTLLDSREATWAPSALSNVGKGAFVAQPYDSMYAARTQIGETLEDSFGVLVNSHCHGESPTAQQTFDIGEKSLTAAGDAFHTLKFVVRNLATAVNAATTFMPYPVQGQKGNDYNMSVSFWKAADNNLFYDGKDDYAQISQTGRYFIGGVLEHAAALSLFTAPTPNSYRKLAVEERLVGWSATARNALVRVPYLKKNVKETKRIVYTGGDPSANPYLANATLVAAGLDGIKNKIDPGEPVESEGKKKRTEKELPGSLLEAIAALESDTKFIKGVVPSELLGDFLDLKLRQHKEAQGAITNHELEKYVNV
ncbi:MAG: glutamine synthetase family protein [Candidatus Micrarchaeota archaeon]